MYVYLFFHEIAKSSLLTIDFKVLSVFGSYNVICLVRRQTLHSLEYIENEVLAFYP